MRPIIALLAAGLLCGCARQAAAAEKTFRCDTQPVRTAALTVATRLAGVPALLRIPPQQDAPPIVLWHGFGPPASAAALLEALPLDEVRAIKVYLDLPLFGARAAAGGHAELARRQTEDLAGLLFAPAVLGAAAELPAVRDALTTGACLRPEESLALFGFSAGGAAVLYALAERQVPLRAAVVVNASTGLEASVHAWERATRRTFPWSAGARDIAARSDALQRHAEIAAGDPPPALLIVHGAQDVVLGATTARTLFQALLPDYRRAHQLGRLQWQLIPGMAHSWLDAAHLSAVRAATSGWLQHTAAWEAGLADGVLR